jgi:hypothetical protein
VRHSNQIIRLRVGSRVYVRWLPSLQTKLISHHIGYFSGPINVLEPIVFVAGSLVATAVLEAEFAEAITVGRELAVGSLLADPYDSPSAEEPKDLADNHSHVVGREPSAERPMLASGAYQSARGKLAAGWNVLVVAYLGLSHLHLETAGPGPVPLCLSGPCTQETSLEMGRR